MARPQGVSNHYQDEAGARYVQHYQTDPFLKGYAIDFEYFRPHLGPQDTVLDFGCGNGGMLRLVAEHVKEAEGLEVNPHAAEIARSLGLTVHGSIDELPAEPFYDAVISNHVLEHVQDVVSTLERLRSSLKPGGRLLLKLPLDDWRAREQRNWRRDDVNHHLHTWTPLLIGNVLAEAGYVPQEIRVVTSAWHPRLFPLAKIGVARLAFWLVALLKKRRQLFVIAQAPA